MRKLGLLLSFILLIGVLAACGGSNDAGSDNAEADGGEALSEEKLTIGTTAGPHEEVMEKVVELAADEGLEVEPKIFTDYVLPNTALDEGDLDANSYQHQPFLDQFNEDHGTDLVSIEKTILIPMAVYSNKYDDFDDVPEGATFGLPNDPTNGARALFLLEAEGYIKMAEGKGEDATIHDVEDNPKNLEFVELDAAQIPKQLDEVDAAAINTNFALDAGMNPREDSIILESPDSPYVNYFVVRAENENDPVVEKVAEIYRSEELQEFIEEEFDGSVISGQEAN